MIALALTVIAVPAQASTTAPAAETQARNEATVREAFLDLDGYQSVIGNNEPRQQ